MSAPQNHPDTPDDFEPMEPLVNPLPGVVVVLVLIIAAIELAFQLAARGVIGGADGIGWRLAATQDYAFLDVVFEWMRVNGTYPAEHMLRFISYAFVHSDATHTIFVCVFLLALGKVIGESFGTLAVLVLFVISTIAGALAYGLVLDSNVPLNGGFPAAYGMIGGYTYILWVGLGTLGRNQSRAFSLIAFLMGIQLFFGLVFGGAPIWVAELAGFVAGFLLSFILAPGGVARIVARARNR